MQNDLRERLINYVDNIVNLLKQNAKRKLILSSLVIFLVATLSFILLDLLFYIKYSWAYYYRLITLILIVIFSFYYYFKISYLLSRRSVTRLIEKKDPCDNCLVTAIEIGEDEIKKYGFSEKFYDITLNKAASYYLNKDPLIYTKDKKIKKLIYVVLILLFSNILMFFVNQNSIRSLNKIWPQLAYFIMPKSVEIISNNKDFVAFVDEPINLSFLFERNEKLKLYIFFTNDNEKNKDFEFNLEDDDFKANVLTYTLDEPIKNNNQFEYKFQFLASSNFYYYVNSLNSDSSSKIYFVKLKKRPEIIKLSASYKFPAYTKIAPMVEENVSNITGLFMTDVTLKASFNKQIKDAKIIFSNNIPYDMKILPDNVSATFSFKLTKNDTYYIEVIDIEGVKNRKFKSNEIVVYEDKTPTCMILEPGLEIVAPYEKQVNVTIKAKDDFLISKLELVYFKTESESNTMDVLLSSENLSEVITKVNLDFSLMTFKPGESLYYYAIAYDNDDISGPKFGKSNIHKINFPTLFEEAVSFEAMYDSIEAKLDKITKAQKNIYERIEKIDTLKKQNAITDLEVKKNYESIVKEQENLMNEAKNLVSDLKETVKKMENNIYIKPETISKIAEIQDKLEKILNDDMKKLISELNKDIEKVKLSNEDVKQMAQKFDEKKLIEKFERLKQLFEKVEKEQKLATFINELENILSKQELIAENTEKADSETIELNQTLAYEQKLISESYKKAEENFEKNIEDISSLSDILKEAANDALKSLKDDKVSDTLQKAESNLSNNNPKDAFSNQKLAMESIKNNISKLKNAFNEFKSKNKDELLSKILILINHAIAMSKLQSEIVVKLSNLSKMPRNSVTNDIFIQNLDEISEKYFEMSNLIKFIANELISLSKKSIVIDSNHIALVGNIVRDFERLKPMISEREHVNINNYSYVLYSNINALNIMLLEIYDIIKNAKSGSNMDQLMSMLKKQAEAQARLNAKTKQLMQQMGEGGLPKLTEEALKSLAFEQQVIRRAIEQMLDSMNYNDSEIAKKLREIRSEMRNLEVEYLHKKLDQKIQSRQKILHERLLDLQKALFKEKETTERKAEQVKKYIKTQDVPLVEAQKFNQKEILKDDLNKLEKYPKSYEKIIELYLEVIKNL